MLNFESMPTENPFGTVEPGLYYATIAEAEMKTPKAEGKADYLNIKLALTTIDGKNAGNVYDIISESDSSVVQYKVGRFIRACGIPLVGSMSLVDISKIVRGKKIGVDITLEKKKDGVDKPRAIVDIFGREAYYTVEEFAEVYATVNPPKGELNEFNTGAGDEVPFDGAPTAPAPGAAQY